MDERSEMGGTQVHAWPNGGGGFTTSTLGEGGYPEWTFDGYYPSNNGAELYEVTPQGREMLRSVYRNGKWQTYENHNYPTDPTSRTATSGIEGMSVKYGGHRFMVRGKEKDRYLLSTYDNTLDLPGMFALEKGIRALWIPKTQTEQISRLCQNL